MSKGVRISIPLELAREIDSVMGRGKRRAFVSEAAREELIRRKQSSAIRKYAGSLKDEDYPEWKNGSAEWVHNLRQEDQRIRDRRLIRSRRKK